MMLDKKIEGILYVCNNFSTFASIGRHSCRLFSYEVFYFFGLATRGACSLTGLFLFCNPLPIKRLRTVVFIPVKLIKKAHEEDWLRSLAYFVRMKSLYVNNTHYRYSLRSLSKKLGASPACLSYHIKLLIQKGVVEPHGKNMTFKGLRRLSALFGAKNIGVKIDFKNQFDILRSQLIRFNLAQQEHNIKKSGVQKCPIRYETPNNFSERMNSCYAGLSAHGFGKVLDLSSARGAELRGKFIRLGLLSFRRRFSIYFSLRGPSGGSCGRLKELKRQGLVPYYAKLSDGRVMVERRMELKWGA